MTKCIIKRNTDKYVQSFKYSNCYAFYEILKDKYKKMRNFSKIGILSLIIVLIVIIPFMDSSFKDQSKLINDITDTNHIEKFNEDLRNSIPGPHLSFHSFQINDDNYGNSRGDCDGKVDAGEIIEMRLTLQNTGDQDALNVNATISTSDGNIKINDGFQDFTTVIHGSTGNSASFYSFRINSSCSANYYIPFNLEINASNGGPWYDTFQIHVIGRGNPIYHTYSVYSESDGDLPADKDDIIDPGEIIEFDIKVKNNGEANLYGISGLIEINEIYITIDNNQSGFGDIERGGIESGRFGMTILGTCPDKHQINITLTLTDQDGTEWISPFFIIVNGKTNYKIMNFDVSGEEGDDDGHIDAGESWYVSIEIINIGSAIGKNVKVYLDSDDKYISFNVEDEDSRYLVNSEININEIGSYSDSSTWRFKISAVDTPSKHKIEFKILITDDSGYEKEFEVSIKVDKGAPFTEVDWAVVGIVFLYILGIIGIGGLLIANSYYNWNIASKVRQKFSNISTSRYIKKKKKLREKEIESKTFKSLLKKSKELVDIGKQNYSKELFKTAIDNWNEAIKNYELALMKAPSSKEKTKIHENQRILKENICNAYVEKGKKHNLIAKRAHKEKNIQKAQIEWNSAKEDFQSVIDFISSENLDINYKDIEVKINSIELNLSQLEIEKICLSAEEKLESAKSLADTKLEDAIEYIQDSISQYFEARNKAINRAEFQNLVNNIQKKLEIARNLQSELHDKMDELLGITPITTKVITDDEAEYDKVETILKAGVEEKALSIIREYEFIGGQIRFKVALINNTRNPLTNFRVSFDIPDAVKWIMHEPKYERRGDSILIPKLGVNEKKAVSLYLEPINCMESPINATVSFFDAKDRPQAVPMKPKMIMITCPLFFTEQEANLARVKQLHQTLYHRDKRIFPIIDPKKTSIIFSSVLSALGKHDIKLIFKEFTEKNKYGEAWYYGVTKVKKERIITHISINGERKTLELEVSGNKEEQITAFLAEISNDIRKQLLEHNIITSEDQFYDMSVSIQLYQCPFCWSKISPNLVQKYLDGEPIKCKYCNESLTLKED